MAKVVASRGKRVVKKGLEADEVVRSRAVPESDPRQAELFTPDPQGIAPDPMPGAIEPCLPTPVDKPPAGELWWHEIKWDGMRLIAFLDRGAVRLQSRDGEDWTARFPIIARALAFVPADTAILDGEAVVEDENGLSSLAALEAALGGPGRETAAADAVLYAFDLLYRDGRDLRREPLEVRRRALDRLLEPFGGGGALRYSDHVANEADALLRQACAMGLAGIVSKRRDQPYASGRTSSWLGLTCVAGRRAIPGVRRGD